MITRQVSVHSIRDFDRRLRGMRLQPAKYYDDGGVEYIAIHQSLKYHNEKSKKKKPLKTIAVINVDAEANVTKLKFKKTKVFSKEDIYRVLALAVRYDFIINEQTKTFITSDGNVEPFELFPDSK